MKTVIRHIEPGVKRRISEERWRGTRRRSERALRVKREQQA
jgi:hypothetical protein